MQKMYDDEEEVEEGGDGNQSWKAAGHQEWVPDPGREEEDSDQSRTAWGHREWVPDPSREEEDEEDPRCRKGHHSLSTSSSGVMNVTPNSCWCHSLRSAGKVGAGGGGDPGGRG
jgi:hypothetical protein